MDVFFHEILVKNICEQRSDRGDCNILLKLLIDIITCIIRIPPLLICASEELPAALHVIVDIAGGGQVRTREQALSSCA